MFLRDRKLFDHLAALYSVQYSYILNVMPMINTGMFQIGGTTLHAFAGIGSGSAVISTCIELAKARSR